MGVVALVRNGDWRSSRKERVTNLWWKKRRHRLEAVATTDLRADRPDLFLCSRSRSTQNDRGKLGGVSMMSACQAPGREC
jgi:hypothetical protein